MAQGWPKLLIVLALLGLPAVALAEDKAPSLGQVGITYFSAAFLDLGTLENQRLAVRTNDNHAQALNSSGGFNTVAFRLAGLTPPFTRYGRIAGVELNVALGWVGSKAYQVTGKDFPSDTYWSGSGLFFDINTEALLSLFTGRYVHVTALGGVGLNNDMYYARGGGRVAVKLGWLEAMLEQTVRYGDTWSPAEVLAGRTEFTLLFSQFLLGVAHEGGYAEDSYGSPSIDQHFQGRYSLTSVRLGWAFGDK
jgi:hypothetical protein